MVVSPERLREEGRGQLSDGKGGTKTFEMGRHENAAANRFFYVRFLASRGSTRSLTWKMRQSSSFFFSRAHFLSSSKLHLLKQASKPIISSMQSMLRPFNFLGRQREKGRPEGFVGTVPVSTGKCEWAVNYRRVHAGSPTHDVWGVPKKRGGDTRRCGEREVVVLCVDPKLRVFLGTHLQQFHPALHQPPQATHTRS